jgi:hypothetical protein
MMVLGLMLVSSMALGRPLEVNCIDPDRDARFIVEGETESGSASVTWELNGYARHTFEGDLERLHAESGLYQVRFVGQQGHIQFSSFSGMGAIEVFPGTERHQVFALQCRFIRE